MSVERGTIHDGFKVGEDWSLVLTFKAAGVPFDWSGCSAKLTCRYGEGETAEEAFTLSDTATADGSITFGGAGTGTLTVALNRSKSVLVRPSELTGDVLVVDSLGRSLYYLDLFLTVDPRSTVR